MNKTFDLFSFNDFNSHRKGSCIVIISKFTLYGYYCNILQTNCKTIGFSYTRNPIIITGYILWFSGGFVIH